MKAYHFNNGKTLRDGSPLPPIGEWLKYAGPLVPCESGLHASLDPWDALQYAPGATLDLVELDGEMIEHGDPPDKWVATRRKRIASIDATELLRAFARWCALQVIDLWDAPAVVREYLETGDESKRLEAQATAWAAQAAQEAAEWAAQAAQATQATAWAARKAQAAAWRAEQEAAAWRAEQEAAEWAAQAAQAAQATAWAARKAQEAQRAKFRQMVEEAFQQ